MKALIIAAHGSRNNATDLEIIELKEKVAEKAHNFDIVMHAFLQFSSPFLPDVIETLAKKGVSEIVLFPLFIAAGSHVLKDIPQIVEKARQIYPQVKICIIPHLGASKKNIADLILGRIALFNLN